MAGEYDVEESLSTSPFPLDEEILAPYSTVVWHQNDRTGNRLLPYFDGLASYLSQGGNLFLGGWDLARQLSESNGGPVDFAEGSFPHDYLKLSSAETLMGNVQDFGGADGSVAGYPDLAVDSTKAWLFGGNLFNMDLIYEPLVDEPLTEPIYTYHSSRGDTATYQGEIVGLRYLGDDYHLVLCDFPIFYMERDAAREALAQVMADLGERVGIATDGGGESSIPRAFALHQNYPNPFNPATSIVVDIPSGRGGAGEAVKARLAVYDMRGRCVRILMDSKKKPGRYVIHWDGRDSRGGRMGSGLYFYRMEAGSFMAVRKMLLLK